LDPLAQLKDIHLPQQINNYPFAIGWWLLAIISLVLLVWGIIKVKRYRSQRKDKNIALKQLKGMSLTNSQIISLLKWCCLQYFPRTSSASLFGNNFRCFLINALPSNKQSEFTNLSENIFTRVYQLSSEDTEFEESENGQFQQAAQHWLKHALPPKIIKSSPKHPESKLDNHNQQKGALV